MNNDCSKIIDETLTAKELGSSLSKSAANHISSCSECQKLLNTIAVLTSSKTTALLPEDNTALKTKILSKLTPALKSSAALSGAKPTLTALKLLTIPIVATTLVVGTHFFSKSSVSLKETTNGPTIPIPQTSDIQTELQQEISDKDEIKDLKNLNPASATTQTVPSSTIDN